MLKTKLPFLLALLLIITFASCEKEAKKSSGNSIIGNWLVIEFSRIDQVASNWTFSFFDDGTFRERPHGSSIINAGDYTLEGSRLILYKDIRTETYDVGFTNDLLVWYGTADTLTLKRIQNVD